MDCQDYITESAERKKRRHLQREERGTARHLKRQGYANRAVARQIGCLPSTAANELRRGGGRLQGQPGAFLQTPSDLPLTSGTDAQEAGLPYQRPPGAAECNFWTSQFLYDCLPSSVLHLACHAEIPRGGSKLWSGSLYRVNPCLAASVPSAMQRFRLSRSGRICSTSRSCRLLASS